MVERINVGHNEQPGASDARAAHEAAMVEKAEGVTFTHSDKRTGVHATNQGEAPAADAPAADPAPAADASARPEGVPEKFWDAAKGELNVDALLKSQQELEKQFTQSRQKVAGEEAPEGEAPVEGQDTAVAKARTEFADTGALTAETYAALEKTGLDRSTVDSYIQGQQTQVDSLKKAAYAHTEGEDGFAQMAEWARGELSKGEIAALDHLLASTDPEVVSEGARQLAEKFNSNAPVEPTNTVHGQTAESGSHYRSRAEMVKDMSSKQYKNDPAFRAEVATKIAKAARAGIELYG